MRPQTFFEDMNISEQYLGMVDRYFLMSSHPRKIVFDIVGAIWGTYFLWNQNRLYALGALLVMDAMGLFFTRKIDPELMSQTTIGKIGLLHKHPLNFMLNLIGLGSLVYGLWLHSAEMILIGFSVIVIGHFFGWSEVNAKLRMI